MKRSKAGFDRIATHYRLLEYLSMGRLLERTRFHFLDAFADTQNALVLGDGDGRFTERLLQANRSINVTAVDSSGEMLRLLEQRCAAFTSRLRTVHQDAVEYAVENAMTFNLVATHFFLDCLTQEEVERLTAQIARRLSPGGLWVISEFRIPPGCLRVPAWMMVRGLYLVFLCLAGLKPKRLPDYEFAMRRGGMERTQRELFLGGALTAELWRKPESSESNRTALGRSL